MQGLTRLISAWRAVLALLLAGLLGCSATRTVNALMACRGLSYLAPSASSLTLPSPSPDDQHSA